jgi:diguanylate cyclase (GGDEF)-like protein
MKDVEFNVLIVDDVAENIDLLRAILNPLNCKVSVATNGQRALTLTEKLRPDLILLDVTMPDIDGFQVCKQIRATDALKDIPIIFVTGRADDVSTGFSVGGDDYIAKPIQADEVIARVKHQIEKRRLLRQLQYLNADLEDRVRERTKELASVNRKLRDEINERRYMQDRLQYLAEHDFVSRTYNRNALESYVSEIINRSVGEDVNSTFVQVDLNRFRVVNDSCGCIAGDELLAQAADMISLAAGSDGFIARLGSDRFAIAYTHQSKQALEMLFTSIQEQFEQFCFVWDDFKFHVDATIVAIAIDDRVTSFEQLIMVADELTYISKKEGSKTVRMYQADDILAISPYKQSWALRLVDALKHDHFEVHVQRVKPISVVGSKIKLEALIRLQSFEHQELLYPDSFLYAAERYQLMPDVDRWMITHVIDFLSENRDFQTKIQSIAINLSSSTLKDPELAQFVQNACNDKQVPIHLLSFEVTETEQIIHVNTAAKVLSALQNLGCEILIDDFGSGYSSYNYLRVFPFDVIKIDGIFVREIEQSISSLTMVKSILELAKQLNKPVVAEYVENESLFAMLKELNVDWGQGYFFHKPERLTRAAIELMMLED